MHKNYFHFTKLIASIVFIFLSSTSFGQVRTIKGKVIDKDSRESLPGASVLIKGTSIGTATDVDGNFTLTIESDKVVLQVTFISYQSSEFILAKQTDLLLELEQTQTALNEVVVIGYGKQRKIDLTGSSVSLKSDEIMRTPTLSATEALQGKAAGVQIIKSGAPGSAPNIRIRGTGSILGGVDPLYVVDGIITNDIRNINSADIVSMDVLKDASSTSIYGARAANGVVLITTKKGKEGFSVSYNASTGVKMLTNMVKMAPPNLFAVYSNEAAGSPTIEAADITGATNWYDELTRPALYQNHTLAISGGGNKYKYYLSAGYLNENGLLHGNNYERITLRYNHEYSITDKIKVGNTLATSLYDSQNKPYSSFTTAYIAAPIYNAKNPDGTYGYTTKSDVGNPLAALDYTNDRSYGYRPQATLWGEYNILKDLSFKTSFGIDAEFNKGTVYNPVYAVGTTTQKNEVSSLTYRHDSIYQWVWDNYINYEKEIGEGNNLKLTLGHTAERRDGWRNRSERKNIDFDEEQWELDFTDTTGRQQNFRDPIGRYYRRQSYFIRANYVHKDKYLLNATFRRDANSNFAENNRWGSFPAIGFGWIISNEAFFKSNIVDIIKLRASYGLVGNDVINPGQFELRPTEYLYAYFGDTYINGATVTGIVDPNLQWEVAKEFDVGVELSLWNGEIVGEIDFYYKKASGALYIVPLPTLGFGSAFLTNAADIINEGIEFSVSWNKTFNNDKFYKLRVNTTYNKNTVENIGIGKPLNFGSLNNGWTATQTIEGQPIGSFWVYRTEGIFQSQDEINNYPTVPNAQPGDFKIVDINDDGLIDSKDREHVGSYQPKVTLGITQSFNYKNFDFSLDLYGVFGNKVYNAKKGVRYGGNYNIEYDVAVNRWQPGSGENENPRAFNGVPYPTDYFVESGSYIKINDISIGYTMENLFNAKHLDRLRVYVSSQNPYVFTKYTGFTPELPGNQNEAGIELNIYPVSTSILFGLNLQLK